MAISFSFLPVSRAERLLHGWPGLEAQRLESLARDDAGAHRLAVER